mmetsp:Transcript_24468/g.63783  ORF Transcript_24468/g.63783 Transcript_24468/m.63783 type:complete len:623 (+) Transcript_24468:374-2242(+)
MATSPLRQRPRPARRKSSVDAVPPDNGIAYLGAEASTADSGDDADATAEVRGATLLKEGHLTKLALGRSRFGSTNWKKRWFLLREDALLYFKASDDVGRKRPSGVLPLDSVCMVETVEENETPVDLPGRYEHRQPLFQVGFADGVTSRTLLVQASDKTDRQRWVDAIRAQFPRFCGTAWLEHYHVGVQVGKDEFSCCGKATPEGCQPTTPLPVKLVENYEDVTKSTRAGSGGDGGAVGGGPADPGGGAKIGSPVPSPRRKATSQPIRPQSSDPGYDFFEENPEAAMYAEVETEGAGGSGELAVLSGPSPHEYEEVDDVGNVLNAARAAGVPSGDVALHEYERIDDVDAVLGSRAALLSDGDQWAPVEYAASTPLAGNPAAGPAEYASLWQAQQTAVPPSGGAYSQLTPRGRAAPHDGGGYAVLGKAGGSPPPRPPRVVPPPPDRPAPILGKSPPPHRSQRASIAPDPLTTPDSDPKAWHVHGMGREEVKQALTGLPVGAFVIRDSSSDRGAGAVVLCVRMADEVVERKIGLEKKGGGSLNKYIILEPGIGIKKFASLAAVVGWVVDAKFPAAAEVLSSRRTALIAGTGKDATLDYAIPQDVFARRRSEIRGFDTDGSDNEGQ